MKIYVIIYVIYVIQFSRIYTVFMIVINICISYAYIQS